MGLDLSGRRRAPFVFLVFALVHLAAHAELAEPVLGREPVAATSATMSACERIVHSPECSEFRLRRTDLKDQFLRCDGPNPGASSVAYACGKGLVSAAKEYVAIFDPPELNATGQAFHGLLKGCFADVACREANYKLGVPNRQVGTDELQRLAKVPTDSYLRVQPFYYGTLERLKQMKAKELDLAARGLDPTTSEGQSAMREAFPGWKPEYRLVYTEETWSESARKMTKAVTARVKELGIELKCLDEPTVTEMMCFGAGFLVDPAVALKGVTAFPRAAKVLGRLLRASGELKSAAVLKVEAKWGRTLTADELKIVDEAHRVGALEKGKDGSPAGLGNYTLGQLRRKHELLSGKFDSAQIRDLMESGAVGMSVEEIAQARALRPAADLVPSRRLTADAPDADAVFAQFARAESNTTRLTNDLAAIDARMSRYPEFQKVERQVQQLESRQRELLESWDAGNTAETLKRQSQLEDIEVKLARARRDVELWQKRATNSDWSAVAANPQTLMANRTYDIATRAGENLKVSFNEKVVQDLAWSTGDNTRERAIRSAVESLAQGTNQSLKPMTLGDDIIYKIQIRGTATGAYRVYGMKKDGVLYFVHWEHESVHDSAYLQRVRRATLEGMRSIH